MRRDSRVFLIGEDIGVYGGAFKVTQGFLQEFGEDRVIDSPLSETAIVGSCTGAALIGTRPVCITQTRRMPPSAAPAHGPTRAVAHRAQQQDSSSPNYRE